MDDFDLELLRKKQEQEMNNFFPLYEQQKESFVWGYNAVAISNLRLPTSVPSWDNWGILFFFETELLLAP